jgi:hypothetical protein
LLPVPQTLLELGGSRSNLEDPLPSHQLVLFRLQSLYHTFSPAPNLMSSTQNSSLSAPPHSFPGGLPPCRDNFGSDPLTIGASDLLFCTLFQNYKNIPYFETSFQPFPFQNLPPRRPLPLCTPTGERPHTKGNFRLCLRKWPGGLGGSSPPERGHFETTARLC